MAGEYIVSANTKLLIPCAGADGSTSFTDVATSKSITATGTASVETSVANPWGNNTGVLFLDGNSDYLTLSDSDDWAFATSNFTIDFWVRFPSITAEYFLFGQFVNSSNFVICLTQDTGDGARGLIFYVKSGGTIITLYYSNAGQGVLSANTWLHLALVRNGTSFVVYLDGVPITWTTHTAIGNLPNLASTWRIGARQDSAAYLNGYISHFRVTNGEALWTSTFTPPTEAYSSPIKPKNQSIIIF